MTTDERAEENAGMTTKSFKVKALTAAEEDGRGKVKVVFATLDVVDKDRDVIMPGSIESGERVRISAFGHSSWDDRLPVGKGVIYEQGNEAIFEGEFFLATTHGRDTYETVKAMEDLQEWSWGFDVLKSEDAVRDDRSVRLIKEVKVYEVSPVLLGAGVNTRTLGIKSNAGGLQLKEHATSALDGVRSLVDRLQEIAGLREAKGKNLSESSAGIVEETLSELERTIEVLRELKSRAQTGEEAPQDVSTDELVSEAARFQKHLAFLRETQGE